MQNIACSIKAHKAGLFSLVNNALTCRDRYRVVHVDWSDSIYGQEDLYPKLFKASEFSMNALASVSLGKFDTITDYPDKWLTYNNVHKLYTGYRSWRNRLHPHWQRMGVLPHLTDFAESFAQANFGAYNIGILIRATTHAGEQIKGGSQSLEDYIRAIAKQSPSRFTKIFVMSQDEESLRYIRESQPYPVITHPGTKRSPSRDIDRHLREPQTHKDAIVCMEEMLLLTKCDVLIHPISDIATAALIANPALKSIYLPA